jgi:hypothetical protein
MRRSKLLLTLAVSAMTTTAVMAACSFPSITFAPAEGGSSGTSGTSGGSRGGDDDSAVGLDGNSPDAEAGPGEEPKGDAAPEDAPHDAVPANQDAAGCCDCDGDGYYRQDGGCAGLMPIDCDDSNTLVNAGRTYNADPAEPIWKGDWNCNGKVETFYTDTLNCGSKALSQLLSGTTCDQFKGFTAPVVCGSQGSYVTCKTGTLTCTEDTSKTILVKQQCQ